MSLVALWFAWFVGIIIAVVAVKITEKPSTKMVENIHTGKHHYG